MARTTPALPLAIAVLLLLPAAGRLEAAPLPDSVRITVLADAFGEPSVLRRDWGYAALVEYGDLRILFDAGNDSQVLAHNAAALGVDLASIDFVVISHRHGDHTDGLHHLRRVRPGIRVYAPNDEAFGGDTPLTLLGRRVPELPAEQRYFDGERPARVPHGTAWRGFDLVLVEQEREVAPGVRLVAAGDPRGPNALPELALVLETSSGPVVLVGCAHPGLAAILEAADAGSRDIALLAGGFHWVTASDAAMDSMVADLQDRWRVASVAPGHCTSEPGFARLRSAYADRYRFAGVGSVLAVGY